LAFNRKSGFLSSNRTGSNSPDAPLSELYLLKNLLEIISTTKTQGSYTLSEEERLALHHFNQAANMGEDYGLFLLQMAGEVGIEPWQLLYLRRLAGLDVTAIE
jgi:hypothetical protein